MFNKKFLILSAALLLSITFSQAKKDIAVRNTRKVRSPRVTEDCGCLNFGSASACLSMTPPMVKVGWQTDQVASSVSGDNYWQVRFKPYVEVAATIESELIIEDIYSNTLTVDVDKFMANIFAELYVFSTGEVCFNTGY